MPDRYICDHVNWVTYRFTLLWKYLNMNLYDSFNIILYTFESYGEFAICPYSTPLSLFINYKAPTPSSPILILNSHNLDGPCRCPAFYLLNYVVVHHSGSEAIQADIIENKEFLLNL